ncbi:hypothetical protein ABTX81_30460 [Kitasatospora sp. NPDC097605]|uniref:hypothetical protein n=1 Tax=Kitasatospora sp. NPDC097605 TaxID=3157226 RepID=UPI003319C746
MPDTSPSNALLIPVSDAPQPITLPDLTCGGETAVGVSTLLDTGAVGVLRLTSRLTLWFGVVVADTPDTLSSPRALGLNERADHLRLRYMPEFPEVLYGPVVLLGGVNFGPGGPVDGLSPDQIEAGRALLRPPGRGGIPTL